MTTRLQEKYGPYFLGIGDTLKQAAKDIINAESAEDLANLGRRLELCLELSTTLSKQWQASVLEFAALDEWNDAECTFHFRDYKPLTCAVCRQTMIKRELVEVCSHG